MAYDGPHGSELDPDIRVFYRQALLALHDAQVPFVVGGAYAFPYG
jgi:hypothetical protein